MSDLIDHLKGIVGEEHVLTSKEDREFYSMDAFWDGAVAAAVAQPGTTQELAEVVKAVTDADYAVVPRGGGLSYTSGYVPKRERSVTIDTTRLDRIIEINAVDMCVTAEAGCTWISLYEALKEQRLRIPFFGPLSGFKATLGGTLSNNSVFFGSGLYGSIADSVLSLSVVLADGSIVKTGSRANRGDHPFHRYFGPDLTGLFLSDSGALGVKAEASFRLMRTPGAEDFASFAYDSFEDMFEAQAEIARMRVAGEVFGMDPFLNSKSRLKSTQEAVQTIKDVARSGSSLADGVKRVVGMAAGGTRFLDAVAWSLHVVVEGMDDASVRTSLEKVRQVATRKGKQIPNTIPKVMRATPFRSVGQFLVGQQGERWVPIHAWVPLSRATAVRAATTEYFASKGPVLERYNIQVSQLTAISGTDVVIEPAFYYPDALKPYHFRYLDPKDAERYAKLPAVPGASDAVAEMLRDLSGIFRDLGAAHHQIGKFYQYKEGLTPETWKVVEGLKRVVDPKGLMNPGTLGL